MLKEVDFKRKRYCNSNKMYFCQHLNHSWNNKNCIKFLIKSFLLILQCRKMLIIYQFNNLKYLQYLAIVIYFKKFKQSTIPQKSTRRTVTSDRNALNTNMTSSSWCGTDTTMWWVRLVNGTQTPLNNWISNGNTYVNNNNIPAR